MQTKAVCTLLVLIILVITSLFLVLIYNWRDNQDTYSSGGSGGGKQRQHHDETQVPSSLIINLNGSLSPSITPTRIYRNNSSSSSSSSSLMVKNGSSDFNNNSHVFSITSYSTHPSTSLPTTYPPTWVPTSVPILQPKSNNLNNNESVSVKPTMYPTTFFHEDTPPPVQVGWKQLGQDIHGKQSREWFGQTIDISSTSDRIRVAIGTGRNEQQQQQQQNQYPHVYSGIVRVYELSLSPSSSSSSSGLWTQVGQDFHGVDPFDQKGMSIALSGDGNMLSIAAKGNSTKRSYLSVYRYNDEFPTHNDNIRRSYSDNNNNNTNTTNSTAIYNNNNDKWESIGLNLEGESGAIDVTSSISNNGQIVLFGSMSSSEISIKVYELLLGGVWSVVGNFDDHISRWNKLPTNKKRKRNNRTLLLQAGQNSKITSSMSADGSRIAIGLNGGYRGQFQTTSVLQWIRPRWEIVGQEITSRPHSISLSGSGRVLAIGNPNANLHGQVKVYREIGSNWNPLGQTLNGKVPPSPKNSNEQSVPSQQENDITQQTSPSSSSSSSLSSSTTTLLHNDNPHCRLPQDYFGFSVSLTHKGSRIAIGAPGNCPYINEGEVGDDSVGTATSDGSLQYSNNGRLHGHVQIYDYITGDHTWKQVGDEIHGENENDWCGYSVALSKKGEMVAFGSQGSDDDSSSSQTIRESGQARVYYWNT